MKITIHRGASQIGGCITEICTETSRVFIDMGQNLPGEGEQLTENENQRMVSELVEQNPRVHQAIFYTHAHEDHVGLFYYVPEEVIKHYIGEGSKEILQAKYELIKTGHLLSDEKNDEVIKLDDKKIRILKGFDTWERTKPRCKPKSKIIGDIRITPFFNSHSIYDSYMFLIEADGKRVWHTGDFRRHGYLGKGLMPTVRSFAKNVDILITEGTMLGRPGVCVHERDLIPKMSHVMQAFKYTVVLTSATDIDRLATIKLAAGEAKRDIYICSSYMKKTMEIFTEREKEVSSGLYEFSAEYASPGKIKALQKKGFCLLAGVSKLDRVQELTANLNPSELILIYSAWDGYYKDPLQIACNSAYKNFRDAFHNVVDIHTSGHADRKTLADLCKAVNPRVAIIPIHKEKKSDFRMLNIPQVLKDRVVMGTTEVGGVAVVIK